jgi:hypothetical protein
MAEKVGDYKIVANFGSVSGCGHLFLSSWLALQHVQFHHR